MKQTRSLLWKEWREGNIYLWIGLGTLLVLPILNGLENMRYVQRFELPASDWIFLLGGIFTVTVSVGVSCRDFAGNLETFWQSRPVSVGRWMLVKYLTGLSIVLFCCIVPTIAELLIDRDNSAASYIIWFPFLWTAIYSIGFLAGCVIRKTSQAAMLSIGAMLLLYFLPLILPPLAWLNVGNITLHKSESFYGSLAGYFERDWSWLWGRVQCEFAAGMLGIALLLCAAALIAAKRDWHVSAGRRTMFASAGIAGLLLLSTAAFELGTNTPILQTVALAKNDRVLQFNRSGDRAILRYYENVDSPGYTGAIQKVQSLDIQATGIVLGPSQRRDPQFVFWGSRYAPSPANHPEIQYRALSSDGEHGHPAGYFLEISEATGQYTHEIKLRDYLAHSDQWQQRCFIYGNRLYVQGDQLFIADITDPLAPHVLTHMPYTRKTDIHPGIDKFEIALPAIPDLPTIERAKLALIPRLFDGETLVLEYASDRQPYRLYLYHLVALTDSSATFVKMAEYMPTLVESAFREDFDSLELQNGLLYASRRNYLGLNSMISIFDATPKHPLKEIGHFGAPDIAGFSPLPDGRCVVAGGNKVWLIGPPPKHEN